MAFYILRVLFPALLLDILITAGLRRRKLFLRSDKWAAMLLPVPLYLINAFAWVVFYGGDSQFQGQGAIGVAVFLGFGVAFSVIRFCLGYFFAMELWRKQ